jgi:hypothetical protein
MPSYPLNDAAKNAAKTFDACKKEEGKWEIKKDPNGTEAEMYNGSFPELESNLKDIAIDKKLVSEDKGRDK